MLNKKKLALAIIGLVTVSALAAATASGAGSNPLLEILNKVNQIYDYLTGNVNSKLDALDKKVDALGENGTKVITRTGEVIFAIDTPSDWYDIADYTIPDTHSNESALITVTFVSARGDFTYHSMDEISLRGIYEWYPSHIIPNRATYEILGEFGLQDEEITRVPHTVQFAASGFSLRVYFAKELDDYVIITYAYTVEYS